jgi:hypothetical protein
VADPTALTRDVKTAVRWLGGAFMRSATARGQARAMALDGFAYYFGGRGGVLGAVNAGVVAAVFGFFPAPTVARHWDSARAAATPARFSERYAGTCHTWGRERLAWFAAAAELVDLLESIVVRADPFGAPLFAGWRALPWPDDPPARVAQLAHLLREHRGAAHLTAVRAAGLTPVEATITRDDGARRARFLGWPPPYPPVTRRLLARRAEVEEHTDRLAAPAYAGLDRAAGERLRALLSAACRQARATEHHQAMAAAYRQPVGGAQPGRRPARPRG